MGVVLEAFREGALWWADERLLAVADLHLEKGSSFARRGQMLPPYDTGETLARLATLIDRLQPKTVVALGDSFHDDDGAAPPVAAAIARRSAALQAGRDWVWIAGNHDPHLPDGLAGLRLDELVRRPAHLPPRAGRRARPMARSPAISIPPPASSAAASRCAAAASPAMATG